MVEEKIFTIPMRDAFGKGRMKRADKAMALVKNYLKKHMKSDDVKIGKSINEEIWEHGKKLAPRKIRVHAIKEKDTVYSEIVGIDIKLPSKEVVEKKQNKLMEKLEKIKKGREERKRVSIQEEVDESGNMKDTNVDNESEIEDHIQKETEEMKRADKSAQQKKSGK